MTFGKPLKSKGMTLRQVDEVKDLLDRIPNYSDPFDAVLLHAAPATKPRKPTFNFRKAENNEHRTPRRSNPTVARPVLSRVGRNDAARTYGAYQELFEQGFRRRSEVERAVRQEAREGYGIFYPGHPALRGNGA